MTMMRGVCEDKLLMDWLEQICFPIDASLMPDDIRASALMCQAEMLLGGTTTFIDIYRHSWLSGRGLQKRPESARSSRLRSSTTRQEQARRMRAIRPSSMGGWEDARAG